MSIRPPKLLPIHMSSVTPAAVWTADDATEDPFLEQPYRWTVVFAVTAQPHSYHLSPTPNFWTGSDIRAGDWIATAAGGIANRIVSISAQTATSLTCVVEDVDRFNTFADPQGMGIGIGQTGDGFCFELGEDGLPVLGPVRGGTLPVEFQVDLISRFRHRNLNRSHYRVDQQGQTFAVGDPIYLKADGTYALATSDMAAEAQVIGIVRDTHRYDAATADWFAYKPIGEIVQGITPALPGNPGDLIYVGASGGYTNVPSGNRKPVFIRLETGSRGVLLNRGSEIASGGGGGGDAETYSILLTPESPTMAPIATVSDGSRVTQVSVEVEEPFDDATASLTVGDDGDASRLMDDYHNDLSDPGVYLTTPPYQYTGGNTTIRIYFTPTESNFGRARVTISYV